MTLPLSWNEWAQHDGVALAARVRKGELSARELANQANEAIAKLNPALTAVVEVFEDAIADPGQGRRQSRRPLRRPAVPDEGSRPDDAGAPAGNGLALDARQSRRRGHVPDGEDAKGRTQSDRTDHHAGVRRLQFGRQSRRLCDAQPLEYRLHHLRILGRQRRDGRAGAVPIAHATDGGGSIRIPAGVNGNIGLKVSRGVYSLAPHLSDLSGLVSIQGCQSRSVRDTAAFVDACRGPAPGELMPFWTSPEPYQDMIKRDP